MNWLEAIFLGILQGATEFLPVSSSGHLVLVPAVFDMDPAGLTAISIAHLGTLLAVLVYFYRDLWEIVVAVIGDLGQMKPLQSPKSRLGWYIVLGSIPAAVLGLTLEGFFEELFKAPTWAAVFLIGTAILLVLGEVLQSGEKNIDQVSWLDGLIVGLFQGLALFPGISRSGSTIVGGLLRGFDRSTAARFSFLLGIPAILGAGLLEIVDLIGAPDLAQQIGPLSLVFISAAVSGYACIHWLLQWVKRRSLYPFAVYVAAFGLFYLIFFVWLGIF